MKRRKYIMAFLAVFAAALIAAEGLQYANVLPTQQTIAGSNAKNNSGREST